MKKTGSLDIVNEVLEDCILAYPVSSFIISLYKQYQQRGSLSKKQLKGLHGKASGIEDFSSSKLATLEAIINKMPDRFKSELPTAKPLYEKNSAAGEMIEAILSKYPQHKSVQFLKAKYDNNEPLLPSELNDLLRISKLLRKKS